MSNLIEHRLDRLRAAIEMLPSSREKSLALTKLEECEMWVAKCDTTSLVQSEINLKTAIVPHMVTARYFLDAAAKAHTWKLLNGPNGDGYWVLEICEPGDINESIAIYLCNGQSESEIDREAFQKFVTHHF